MERRIAWAILIILVVLVVFVAGLVSARYLSITASAPAATPSMTPLPTTTARPSTRPATAFPTRTRTAERRTPIPSPTIVPAPALPDATAPASPGATAPALPGATALVPPSATAPSGGAIFPPAQALVVTPTAPGEAITVHPLSTRAFGGPVRPATRTEYDIGQTSRFYRVVIFRSSADAALSYRWQGARIASAVPFEHPAAPGQRLYMFGYYLVATVLYRNVELFVDERIAAPTARGVHPSTAAITGTLNLERRLLALLKGYA